MSRRKVRGTIEQRGDRWWLRIPTETVDPATGEMRRTRQRVNLGTTNELRSEAAARREADAWIARQQPEQLRTGEFILAADYFERFLKLESTLNRKSTQRMHRYHIRKHLLPELGSLSLARVGTAQVKALIARLIERRLRRSTIMVARTLLLQVIRQALLDGFDAQTIDPKMVRVPKESAAEREQRHITPHELAQILGSATFPQRALYGVMGYLGLRISEALGLTWKHLDIDSTQPLASIRQSASESGLFPLKTQTSRADLPIPAELVTLLREYRAQWIPNEADLLFATRHGQPMCAGNLRRDHWHPLLQRLGLTPAGFHALRHGLPRRLFLAGCSTSVVKQLMRHGSLRMTERYTHATAEDLRAAVEASTEKSKTAQPRPTVAKRDAQTL